MRGDWSSMRMHSSSVKADPYQEGDFEVADRSGRTLSVRRARPFLITYWLDASVKEVRVIDIELVTTVS